MKKTEYSTLEMKTMLEHISGMYDLTRVVDPTECRVLEIDEDGHVNRDERCYSVWSSRQRCTNCSSAGACRTGCSQQKAEHFNDHIFDIKSNPVVLKLNDGTHFNAVVELITVKEDDPTRHANDREAENVNNSASQYHASHDGLTGLLNEDHFYELTRTMLLEAPDIPWIMVTGDLMEFRLLNDLFGVQKGNEMLVRTAEVLQKIADDAKGLCARIAGDHFALLLPESGFLEESLNEAARTVAGFCSNGVYTLFIHFGVYEIHDISMPVSVMCDRANVALLTIRDDIRSTLAYFNDEMMTRRRFEQEVITQFDREIKEGRFRMFLQPLTGKDGAPVGAEALVRWIRADGTVVPPVDFIGILERAGLILELDLCIWEQAVKQLSLWKNTEKEKLTISVNMSARDFYDGDIYALLTGLLEKYDVDSSKLRLELTETALLENAERNSGIFEKLRKAGFIIEIDDFGKGHSSLSMLKDIHADVIKIDMEFLRDMESRRRSRIILGSVIDMAKTLGMQVVTEGVETERQMKTLAAMGSDLFQGYYFSPPVSVEEFEKYCQKHCRH